jgi:sRNA-binding carbon storage regulator CsrA
MRIISMRRSQVCLRIKVPDGVMVLREELLGKQPIKSNEPDPLSIGATIVAWRP